jgi:hypothetical protein
MTKNKEKVDQELDRLIERFKNDDEYFAQINRNATSRILSGKTKSKEEQQAEDRLIELVIHNRY